MVVGEVETKKELCRLCMRVKKPSLVSHPSLRLRFVWVRFVAVALAVALSPLALMLCLVYKRKKPTLLE